MRKIAILWIMLAMMGLQAAANDNISFTASGPEAVAVGQQFNIAYTINTQDVKNFSEPSLNGFKVLYGPTRKQQSSVQVINGHTTSTSSITITYVLMAEKEGTFNIPVASIVANGKKVVSNALKIKVLPADKAAAAQGAVSSSSGGTSVSNTDLFITSTLSKTSIYEQEAVLLTYKIYTLVDLRGFDGVKLPDFKGFHSQEVVLPNNRQWGLEHYKGRNYRTTIYRQFVLFPQKAGKIAIEPARFDASVAKATQIDDPFEAFFNGGAGFVEVKKAIVTPKLDIVVKSLPAGKPDNFSGGVGEFKISSSINSTQVKTNDAVSVKLVISGVGNLKLLAAPTIRFPEDFEVYDPKINDELELTTQGQSGTRTIEYLAIPRSAGNFKIPAAELSYFDTRSKSYKVLKTEAYNLTVEKGKGESTSVVANFTNKEDVKVLNEDIRFIKQNKVSLHKKGDFFFDSIQYWLIYIVLGGVFVALAIVYRKQMVASRNTLHMKKKKANKVAVKRLKKAGKLMTNENKAEFYDEVTRALWGYVSDKLSIPVSQLSRDNVESEMKNYGADDDTISTFINVLNSCEYARYSQGNANQTLDALYNDAITVISKMEDIINR